MEKRYTSWWYQSYCGNNCLKHNVTMEAILVKGALWR